MNGFREFLRYGQLTWFRSATQSKSEDKPVRKLPALAITTINVKPAKLYSAEDLIIFPDK